MLAEPKSKQKWSSDPRNTAWTNGKELFICQKSPPGFFIIIWNCLGQLIDCRSYLSHWEVWNGSTFNRSILLVTILLPKLAVYRLPFTVSHDWSMEEYNSVLMIVLDGAFAWSFMITPSLCNMLDITYLKRSIARLTAEYREFPRIQPFLENGYIIWKVCKMRQWYILRRREIIRMLIV